MSCDSLFSQNVFCFAPGEVGQCQLDLENMLGEAATVQCGGYPFCTFELLFAELVWVGGHCQGRPFLHPQVHVGLGAAYPLPHGEI